MLEVRETQSYCSLDDKLAGLNIVLASIDSVIAFLAFYQLVRIHSRNPQRGWTRQKVFHLLIGSSNIGYSIFFIITLIATWKGWSCWSYCGGFILMALPKIPFFAAFLLLLSFWIDLCHQPYDDSYEEEDLTIQEALLAMRLTNPSSTHGDSHRICLPFRCFHVGSRQKIVVLVTIIVFVSMMAFAVLIWIGMGERTIDSSLLARVYVDSFAALMLLLGGALTCYGILLCMKMRRVRSEGAASEMRKVAGLAVVSVVCFTSSAFVTFFTNIPVLYYCQPLDLSILGTCVLMILYYFVGSSVPSGFLLWIVRELPSPSSGVSMHEESRIITFVSDHSTDRVQNPHHWTTVTNLQNQISKGSPT